MAWASEMDESYLPLACLHAKVFAGGGTLETLINGQSVQQNISLADAPR